MTSTQLQTNGLLNHFNSEVWARGNRYKSAEQALLALLSISQNGQKDAVIREVLRDKFARHPELGEELLFTQQNDLRALDLAPSHDLWSGNEILTTLLEIREELAGQEVMRTGMLLATHGSLVLMGQESDLGEALVESAEHLGLEADIPQDSNALSAFENTLSDSIAAQWGDAVAELFEMGKTILLYLSMDGLANENPDYEEARRETRRVLQESANRLQLGEKLWEILERYGGDPDRVTLLLQTIVRTALGRPE